MAHLEATVAVVVVVVDFELLAVVNVVVLALFVVTYHIEVWGQWMLI